MFSLSIVTFLNVSVAQEKRDYVWLVGYEGAEGSNNPDYGLTEINFKQQSFNIQKADIEGLSFGSNSSVISDKEGNLLFFTGGCFVYGKDKNLIENGEQINDGEFKDRCVRSFSYISGNASTLFLPNSGNQNEYFLIHQRVEATGSDGFSTLLYSKIDVTPNNGLGTITEVNTPISDVKPFRSEMAAVKHSNGESWWLIVPEDSTNNYNIILINQTGIKNIRDQNMGNKINRSGIGTGQCKFSPDGTKFARWTSSQQLLFTEFDRTTGTFFNEKQIPVLVEGTRGGTEFSPNSRFLYVSTSDSIFQFDTFEDNIENSKVLVTEWDGFLDFLPTKFRRMQLTPDCRIFINLPGSHRFFHIIQNPNEKGIACNFEQRGLSLGRWSFNTMPYFPNYNLGALGEQGGYPCDSTKITVSRAEVPMFQPTSFVFPNPTTGSLQIDLPPNVGELNFQLFDMSGRQVFTKNKVFSFEKIQLKGASNGLYFYKIFDKKGRTWSGKVVVSL